MGQRLIVKVMKNNEEIANVYYHWGAYTIPAFEHSLTIANAIDIKSDVKATQLAIIKAVEKEGGCIDMCNDKAELKRIQALFPNETFNEDGSRNDGLVAITEEGMKEIKGWAEGFAFITITDDDILIGNDCCWVEEYPLFKENNPDSDIDINELPRCDMFPWDDDISYHNVPALIELLEQSNECFFNYNGMVLELIC